MTGPIGLHHAFLLLVTDDHRGTPQIASMSLGYGLAGAFVAELQLRDRLVPEAADTFRLRPGPPSTGSLGAAEARLDGFSGSLRRAIGRLGGWGANARRFAACEELVAMGALRREDDVFLFVRWRSRWPTDDPSVESGLAEHLDRYLADPPPGPPTWEDLLVSLLRGSKALPHVWGPARLAQLRPAIVERTKVAPIGRIVRIVVQEAEAAAAAAAASGFGAPRTAHLEEGSEWT